MGGTRADGIVKLSIAGHGFLAFRRFGDHAPGLRGHRGFGRNDARRLGRTTPGLCRLLVSKISSWALPARRDGTHQANWTLARIIRPTPRGFGNPVADSPLAASAFPAQNLHQAS
jgi:hypothetical protein